MPMGKTTMGGLVGEDGGGCGQLPLLPVYPPGPHGLVGGGGGGGGGLEMMAEAVGIMFGTNNTPTNTIPAICLRQCFMDSLL